MYRQIRKFRESKPLFTLDFWNDGEYSQGCLAGGRVYLHINAGSDYEPCAFIHYSDTNVCTHTLLEALQAPLFTAYKEGQPWNENHLRPCPLLDNPEALVEAVERSGAHSTDLQDPEDYGIWPLNARPRPGSGLRWPKCCGTVPTAARPARAAGKRALDGGNMHSHPAVAGI